MLMRLCYWVATNVVVYGAQRVACNLGAPGDAVAGWSNARFFCASLDEVVVYSIASSGAPFITWNRFTHRSSSVGPSSAGCCADGRPPLRRSSLRRSCPRPSHARRGTYPSFSSPFFLSLSYKGAHLVEAVFAEEGEGARRRHRPDHLAYRFRHGRHPPAIVRQDSRVPSPQGALRQELIRLR